MQEIEIQEDEALRTDASQITEAERKTLFDKYVMPKYEYIEKLVHKYTSHQHNADDNLNIVLLELYRYIHTYDPTKSLDTWLYVITKRIVQKENLQRSKVNANYTGLSLQQTVNCEREGTAPERQQLEVEEFVCALPDDLFKALHTLPQRHIVLIVLRAQGYSVQEIVDMQTAEGKLDCKGKKANKKISNMIAWGKRKIRESLGKAVGFSN